MRVLFLLKNRTDEYGRHASSGLANSVRFMSDALRGAGVDSSHAHVTDGNGVDREVHEHRPDVCVLEAYWVTPEKLAEVARLHPRVAWIVRTHSNVPFFATEMMSMSWTYGYASIPNVRVAGNSRSIHSDLLAMLYGDSLPCTSVSDVLYLPNFYPVSTGGDVRKFDPKADGTVNVGCFGALRPLKNQLAQAIAAVRMANGRRLSLNFHVNVTRLEGGKPVLSNLRGLFDAFSGRHRLVEHGWMEHADFRRVVSTMDVGLQVSYTETFNIVTADFVDQMVPVVVSDEVSWVDRRCHADPNSTVDISEKLWKVLGWRNVSLTRENKSRLADYCKESLKTWIDTLAEIKLRRRK